LIPNSCRPSLDRYTMCRYDAENVIYEWDKVIENDFKCEPAVGLLSGGIDEGRL